MNGRVWTTESVEEKVFVDKWELVQAVLRLITPSIHSHTNRDVPHNHHTFSHPGVFGPFEGLPHLIPPHKPCSSIHPHTQVSSAHLRACPTSSVSSTSLCGDPSATVLCSYSMPCCCLRRRHSRWRKG